MNNKKFLEAIKALRAGLDLMEASVTEGMTESVVTPVADEKIVEKKVEKATKKETPAPTPVVEEVEENADEKAVTQEELIALELVGLKELAKEMGVETKKNDSAKTLSSRIMKEEMGKIVEALTELGYYENDEDLVEEEEETPEEVEPESDEEELATQLAECELDDLADILVEAGLSKKGKKQALIDRILKAVADGKIKEEDLFESDDEEEVEEVDVEENAEDLDEDVSPEELVDELDDDQLKELAEALGLELTVTKKVAGKTKKTFRSIEDIKKEVLAHSDLEEKLIELGYAEGIEGEVENSDEEETEFEVSEERYEAEGKVEADIRKAYKAKKLKDSDIKKFLEKYDDAVGSKEEMLEAYIGIKQNFVDDGGNVNPEEEPYVRDDKEFCCGIELAEADGVFLCEICGGEYNND